MDSILRFFCLIALLFFPRLMPGAQMPAPSAPIPPAVFSAKTIFLSNAGADSYLFPEPFSGDPNRAFSAFYRTIEKWHRYQLVDSPGQADLVFELRLTAQASLPSAGKQMITAKPLPMFRLVIYDRPTHYVLWTLTESIDGALLQKNHDRNFDLGLKRLADDLRRLVPPSRPAP